MLFSVWETRVQDYVKPTFFVEVEPESEAILPGKKLKAKLRAERYAGGYWSSSDALAGDAGFQRLRKAIDETLNIDKVRTGDLGGSASTTAFSSAKCRISLAA